MKIVTAKNNNQTAAKKILQLAKKKKRTSPPKRRTDSVTAAAAVKSAAAANAKKVWWHSLTWEQQSEERRKEQARIAAGIKHYRLYEPINIKGAIPILIDPHELDFDLVDTNCLGVFLNRCYNRHALEVYDHPGDTRCGGFYHEEGETCNQGVTKMVVDSVYQWYQDNIPEGSRMKFKKVTKMSCMPDCNAFFFVTFTVVNKDTMRVKTLQAQVMELNLADWQLGMLRDVSRDRVLAIMKLKQGISLYLLYICICLLIYHLCLAKARERPFYVSM